MTQGTRPQLDSDWYLKTETFICADLNQRLKTALTKGWCCSFKSFHWYWWFFSLFLLGNWTLRAASCGRWQNTGESLGCDMKNLWAAPLWIQLKTFRFFFFYFCRTAASFVLPLFLSLTFWLSHSSRKHLMQHLRRPETIYRWSGCYCRMQVVHTLKKRKENHYHYHCELVVCLGGNHIF